MAPSLTPDTIVVILEAVFTANHLTDTDKQNTVQENKLNKYSKEKENNAKLSETKQSLLYDTRPGDKMDLFYNAAEPRRIIVTDT